MYLSCCLFRTSFTVSLSLSFSRSFSFTLLSSKPTQLFRYRIHFPSLAMSSSEAKNGGGSTGGKKIEDCIFFFLSLLSSPKVCYLQSKVRMKHTWAKILIRRSLKATLCSLNSSHNNQITSSPLNFICRVKKDFYWKREDFSSHLTVCDFSQQNILIYPLSVAFIFATSTFL